MFCVLSVAVDQSNLNCRKHQCDFVNSYVCNERGFLMSEGVHGGRVTGQRLEVSLGRCFGR